MLHIPLVMMLYLGVPGVPAAPQDSQQPLVGPARGTPTRETPTMTATRVDASVSLDGRLDEAAWRSTAPVTGFSQFEPHEGAAATQQTEVRLLYGADHVYVGALLHDDSPDLIEAALGRRDEYNRADWFIVSLDSYFDRRTAYTFAVNAAGIQFDGIRGGGDDDGDGGSDGGGGSDGPDGVDPSWDAIWYSDVRVMSEGWTVEMRIPYSMLRFSEAESQTWGIHFTRDIPRLGEISEWPLVPRTQRSNLIAGYGLLEGITGIRPRRELQVSPYIVSRAETNESSELPGRLASQGSVDAGADLKVGLGPNVTLNATVNPDFGQVESDPAVLNLTAFETSFEERRPFFVEGIQIFNFEAGPGQLLYTRRIGADAPIVGAAKLSGRTSSGLSFGVLGATAGDDFEPAQHYGVGRMIQQIGDFSSLGGILTVADHRAPGQAERRQSVVGGADWDLRLLDNHYGIEGFAALTYRHGALAGRSSETGFATKTWLVRRQGALTGFLGLDIFSDTFNPNDLGQLNENNFVALLVSPEYEINGGRPFGLFQRANVEAFFNQRFSFNEGLDLGMEFEAESRWMTRGFQQFELGVSMENPFGGYDLYETRGLWPWARPLEFGAQAEVTTDERRSWHVEPDIRLRIGEDGGHGYDLGLSAEWNVGSRLSIYGDVEGEWENDLPAWSSNETFLRTGDGWQIARDAGRPRDPATDPFVPVHDGGRLDAILGAVAPIGSNRYFVPLFGKRDTRALDATIRSTVTFVPNLSLQLYGQLFLARGRYEHFQILQDRDNLASFDGFPKQDAFALSSFQTNLVLRWEYRPGSTLFLVWTHGRRDDDELNPLAPWGPSPYDRTLDRRIADTFRIFPENVFLIKLNYTFLY